MIFGLTGGAACGKSTLTKMAAAMGFPVWDADRETRNLYANPDFMAWVEDLIPGAMVWDSFSIDRRLVTEVVMRDDTLLTALTDEVGRRLLPMLERFIAETTTGLIDVPLLLESGWQRYCDRVIVVHCPRDVQLERLQNRGWSDVMIAKVLERQWDDARRFPHAHHLIDSTQDRTVMIEAFQGLLMSDDTEELTDIISVTIFDVPS